MTAVAAPARTNHRAVLLALAGYLLCIIGANAALERWGLVEVLGTMLPAGVWFAGASFTMRDIVDDLGGRAWVLAGILIGGAVSFLFAPDFARASAAAFLVAETFDWLVYRPLRERRWWLAVVVSNIVGSTVDSLLFLWLAFGSVTGWFPLTVAKAVVTVPFLPVIAWWRHRQRQPAGDAGGLTSRGRRRVRRPRRASPR